MEINAHYSRLLGIGEEWKVVDVRLDIAASKIDIYLDYVEKCAPCPECGTLSSIYDCQEERIWRHLDTMQFQTLIHAKPPRCCCAKHGVKVIDIPWAGKNSHFTLLFEAFAIEILKGTKSVSDAQRILRLNWHQVQRIKEQAVKRGLERRSAKEISFIGMDEKSFLAGRHSESFVCIMTDIDGNRVLEVSRGRSEEGAAELINRALNPVQQYMVSGVAMDMSAPFTKVVRKHLVNAGIVYDRFHLVKHLNDAVDKVRRSEHARFKKAHDRRLAKTRYLWLKGFESLSPEAQKRLKDLVDENLLTGKAWGFKEAFREFWKRRDKSFAEAFFNRWFEDVIASGIKPMIRVANMFKRHLEGILRWYDMFITNAITENFNAKIQAIKANARGFRNFENYRIAILFNCGDLDLLPIV